jgi:hypothetical protein
MGGGGGQHALCSPCVAPARCLRRGSGRLLKAQRRGDAALSPTMRLSPSTCAQVALHAAARQHPGIPATSVMMLAVGTQRNRLPLRPMMAGRGLLHCAAEGTTVSPCRPCPTSAFPRQHTLLCPHGGEGTATHLNRPSIASWLEIFTGGVPRAHSCGERDATLRCECLRWNLCRRITRASHTHALQYPCALRCAWRDRWQQPATIVRVRV